MKNLLIVVFVFIGFISFTQDFDVYGIGENTLHLKLGVKSKTEIEGGKDEFIVHLYDTNGRLQSSSFSQYQVEILNSGFGGGDIVLGDTSVIVYRKVFYHYENDRLAFETQTHPHADGADTLTKIDTTAFYSYNSDGLLSERIKDGITSKYTYDDRGNEIRVQIFGLDEKDPANFYGEASAYNKKNQRISTKTEDPSFPFEIHYVYSKKGNLIQETRGFKNKEQIPVEYLYNKKGLLVERRLTSDLAWLLSSSTFFKYTFYNH